MRRAIYLRLYALGFLPWNHPLRDDSDCSLANPDLRSGWKQFLDAMQDLRCLQAASADDFSRSALELLFGQDRLLAALAAAPGFCEDPAHSSFVQAIGRVELWLLGHDLPIGPPPA